MNTKSIYLFSFITFFSLTASESGRSTVSPPNTPPERGVQSRERSHISQRLRRRLGVRGPNLIGRNRSESPVIRMLIPIAYILPSSHLGHSGEFLRKRARHTRLFLRTLRAIADRKNTIWFDSALRDYLGRDVRAFKSIYGDAYTARLIQDFRMNRYCGTSEVHSDEESDDEFLEEQLIKDRHSR